MRHVTRPNVVLWSFFPAVAALVVAALVAGCGGNSSSGSGTTTPTPTPTASSTIKHIVIIMQENRSFDNLFNGFPGADTVTYGMSKGRR